MSTFTHTRPELEFHKAALRLKKVVHKTPLMYNNNLSKKYQCNVYLKREDLQVVRSYKLRGAYNMMSSLSAEELQRGVVCASAGNQAWVAQWMREMRRWNAVGVNMNGSAKPRYMISER